MQMAMVVGLVQEKREKKWWCLYPYECVGWRREEKKKKRVERTDWGREKGGRKQSKERRNKNGGWEETNKDGVNVDGRVWQDAALNVCLQELSQRSTLCNKSEFSLCACVCVHMHAYRHHARVAFKWKVFVCFCIICPHLSVYLSVAAKRQKRHTHTHTTYGKD